MNVSRPLQRALQWVLTLCGFAFAFILAIALFYMIRPVDFDSAGVLGLYAFLIPSQLLIVGVLAVVVAAILWRIHWRWPCAAFASIALVALPMSLWPTVSLYSTARQHDVELSFVESLIPSITLGGAQQERSVRYATVDGVGLMLDVWPAAATANSTANSTTSTPRPAIVRLHGGGWIAGTRSEFPEWNAWFNELGYVVFDVEYRLAPPVRWLDEVGDVKCALGWLASHVEQYHIDANRISLVGNSAGGHLAMLAAYSMDDPKVPSSCDGVPVKVNAVVNVYGPSDLPHGYYNGGSPRYVQRAMDTFIGGPPEMHAERYRILSPVTYVNAKTPPTITLLGTHDRIVTLHQAEVLDQALTAAGVPHETYLLPASDHGFDANWSGLSAQFARAKVAAFLRRYNSGR